MKLAGSDNLYRVRIGPYRMVYSVEDNILEVYIFDVDDRKDIYR